MAADGGSSGGGANGSGEMVMVPLNIDSRTEVVATEKNVEALSAVEEVMVEGRKKKKKKKSMWLGRDNDVENGGDSLVYSYGRSDANSKLGSDGAKNRWKFWVILGVVLLVVVIVAVVVGVVVSNGNTSSKSDDVLSEEERQQWIKDTEPCRERNAKEESVIVPKRYQVSVAFDESLFYENEKGPYTFEGKVAVEFVSKNVSSCIWLHAAGLDIYSVEIVAASSDDDDNGGSPLVICHNEEGKDCRQVILPSSLTFVDKEVAPTNSVESDVYLLQLHGDHQIEEGKEYALVLQYVGRIGESPKDDGLHRSTAFLPCNTTEDKCSEDSARVLISSQLERVGARRVFPSVDLPKEKAVFVVDVEAPYSEAPVILSNTNPVNITAKEGNKTRVVSFAQTEKMSTYLVAIVAGRLEEFKPPEMPDLSRRVLVDNSEFSIRGWAVPGRQNLMRDAIAYGYKALDFYSSALQIEQPVKHVCILIFISFDSLLCGWDSKDGLDSHSNCFDLDSDNYTCSMILWLSLEGWVQWRTGGFLYSTSPGY